MRHRKGQPDPQCGFYYRTGGSYDDFDRCQFEIEAYCEYGSVSRAQLAGCEKHVRWGQIKSSNTNAALYARLEIDKCLADAGPFCRPRNNSYGDGY